MRIQNPAKCLGWSFEEKINDFQSVTIFAKSYILDIWQGSEYTSDTPVINKCTLDCH